MNVLVQSEALRRATKRAERRATIAKRNAVEAEYTDATCTPKWITDRLPHRNFDPCGNARSTVRADVVMTLDNGLDGLADPWIGTGFMNNPFSQPLPWMQRAQSQIACGNCTDLIVLCKHDPATKWWATLITQNPFTTIERWEPFRRVQYDEHPAVIEQRRLDRIAKAVEKGTTLAKIEKITGKSQANFVSVIVHHRGLGMPRLDLSDVATLWVMGGTRCQR